jgi:hypothetical protein
MTRRLSVFLLAALLSMPAMAASDRGAQLKESGVFSALWGFLGSFVSARPTPAPLGAGVATKAATGCDLGSVMDPNGCPGRGQATGNSPDLGSVMDPNG